MVATKISNAKVTTTKVIMGSQHRVVNGRVANTDVCNTKVISTRQ